jgi:uncharacterized protein (DUF305 family)
MRDTQREEIGVMQGWLDAWYETDHEPMVNSADMKRMEMMETLAPDEYEVAFMKQMIPHHLKAVLSSTPCMIQAEHSELIGMCADIIATQAKEVQTLRRWLCEWYGICRYQQPYIKDEIP